MIGRVQRGCTDAQSTNRSLVAVKPDAWLLRPFPCAHPSQFVITRPSIVFGVEVMPLTLYGATPLPFLRSSPDHTPCRKACGLVTGSAKWWERGHYSALTKPTPRTAELTPLLETYSLSFLRLQYTMAVKRSLYLRPLPLLISKYHKERHQAIIFPYKRITAV